MSHFTVLARFNEEQSKNIADFFSKSPALGNQLVKEYLKEKLLPFCENTKDLPPQYVEFHVDAKNEDVEKEFNEGTFSEDYWEKDKVKVDGKTVYKKSFKEIYGTLENFVKKHHGYNSHNGQWGHFMNPNAKWDWWVLGGRWIGSLPVKPNAIGCMDSETIKSHEKYPDMYGPVPDKQAVDFCRVGDFDFDIYEKEALKDIDGFIEKYDELKLIENKQNLTEAEVKFRNDNFFFSETLAKLGIRKLINNEDGTPVMDGDYQKFSDPVFEDVAFDKQYLLDRMHLFTFSTYAILTENNEWIAPGEMGWFGISNDAINDYDAFKKGYKDIALKGPDNTIIAIIDCHI